MSWNITLTERIAQSVNFTNATEELRSRGFSLADYGFMSVIFPDGSEENRNSRLYVNANDDWAIMLKVSVEPDTRSVYRCISKSSGIPDGM